LKNLPLFYFGRTRNDLENLATASIFHFTQKRKISSPARNLTIEVNFGSLRGRGMTTQFLFICGGSGGMMEAGNCV
jgi:hypothetical protein